MSVITFPDIRVSSTIKCNQCGTAVAVTQAAKKWGVAKHGVLCPACLRKPVKRQWTRQTYHEYLQTSHWEQFRQRAFTHYGRKCYLCGTEQGQIDLHHNNYDRLGGERISDVVPLCHDCHMAHHTEV